MRNLLIILLLCVFIVNAPAQRRTASGNKAKLRTTFVTKSMSDKIADACLYGQGYEKTVFYTSNGKYFSFSEIARGKGTEVLLSLSKYPQYSENFIYAVYQKWGTRGWKQLGFTADEIIRSKKICAKFIAAKERQEEEETTRKIEEETNDANTLTTRIKSGEYIENVTKRADFHINTKNLAEKLFAWRMSEYQAKSTATWDKEILNLDLSIGIKLDKTIEILKIDGNVTPQMDFLANWLKSNIIVDSLAVIEFKTISNVLSVPSKGRMSISDDFECYMMQHSLPIKLKLKRNEQGILYLANESSILETFMKEDKNNANAIVELLKMTITSHPAFQIDKKQFSVTLLEVYKENLKIQGRSIPVGYIFDFQKTKDFNWNDHAIVKYYSREE